LHANLAAKLNRGRSLAGDQIRMMANGRQTGVGKPAQGGRYDNDAGESKRDSGTDSPVFHIPASAEYDLD
ncbi:MAG: hypothetical protein P4M10_08950, partial [Verrucomicrobiae bacterium]|nr:hypothetical protein [Verrucomicrobiae bacterium]